MSRTAINSLTNRLAEVTLEPEKGLSVFHSTMKGMPLEIILLVFECGFRLEYYDLTDHVPSLGQDKNWDSVLIRCIASHTMTNTTRGIYDRSVFRFSKGKNEGFNMTQLGCKKLFEGLLKRNLKMEGLEFRFHKDCIKALIFLGNYDVFRRFYIEIVASNVYIMPEIKRQVSYCETIAKKSSTPITFCVIQESQSSMTGEYFFPNSIPNITAKVTKICISLYPDVLTSRILQNGLDVCPRLKTLSIRFVHRGCEGMAFRPTSDSLTELKLRFHYTAILVELNGLPNLKTLSLKKNPRGPFRGYFPFGLDSLSLVNLVIPSSLSYQIPTLPKQIKVDYDDSY
ncbi:unnamed protein product [Ambrosiozyma monospora]|uniref:Unnamed protein product n=1 Tax=Ambrosiozyma monospora TaxID=43982 RepID=A0A9W6YSM7_AMBMO|nr:unnamed protein product [Ambrosiozyma monospora]